MHVCAGRLFKQNPLTALLVNMASGVLSCHYFHDNTPIVDRTVKLEQTETSTHINAGIPGAESIQRLQRMQPKKEHIIRHSIHKI